MGEWIEQTDLLFPSRISYGLVAYGKRAGVVPETAQPPNLGKETVSDGCG
jgi:hypothetical protein